MNTKNLQNLHKEKLPFSDTTERTHHNHCILLQEVQPRQNHPLIFKISAFRSLFLSPKRRMKTPQKITEEKTTVKNSATVLLIITFKRTGTTAEHTLTAATGSTTCRTKALKENSVRCFTIKSSTTNAFVLFIRCIAFNYLRTNCRLEHQVLFIFKKFFYIFHCFKNKSIAVSFF